MPAVIWGHFPQKSVLIASLKHATHWIVSSPVLFIDLFGADSDCPTALSGIKIESRPEQKVETFFLEGWARFSQKYQEGEHVFYSPVWGLVCTLSPFRPFFLLRTDLHKASVFNYLYFRGKKFSC